MNENLPKKYEKNFFSNFFKKLIYFFFRKSVINKKANQTISSEIVKPNPEKNLKQNNDFVEKINENISNFKTEYDKKQFMENLKNHTELLENFSNERLKIILQYYLDENIKKIELLKKSNT